MEKLIKENEKVWFYLNEEDKENFIKEVNDLNITFNDSTKLTLDNCGLLMAISNYKLAYISGFIWNASFHSNQLNPLRVNYKNYKNKKDYKIIEPNFFYMMVK